MNSNRKMIANHRNRRRNSKKIGLAALIIATILLASCPPPTPDPTPTAPATPTGLTVTATETEVTLSWTAVTGAASYRIYRAEAEAEAMRIETDDPISDPSYTDTDLEIGANYTYTVQAVGSTGLESPHSAPVTATLLVIAPVAPVLTFTAADGTVMLSWNEVERAHSYLIYRDSADTPIVTDPTPYTRTDYPDIGLENGRDYIYTVRAVGSTGLESPHSNPVTARPDTPPAAPTTVTATVSATGDTVMLSWTAVADATTGYRIYRAVVGADAVATPLETDPNPYRDTTYPDSTVVRGTAYSYTVRALKGDLVSEHSDPPATANPPTIAPENLMVDDHGNTEVTLSWDAVENAVNYHITVGADVAVATVPAPADATTITHTVTGLENGEEYTYAVTSSGSNGALSDPSNTVNAYPIAPPTELMAAAGDTEVRLSWVAADGADSYNIYRNGEVTPLVTTPETITGTTYTDTTVTNGMTYTYRVRAVNMAGTESDPSEQSLAATPADPPGIPQNLTILGGDTQLTLRWEAPVGGADSYNIYRLAPAGFMLLTTTPAVIRDTTYTDTGLINDANSYEYVVRAVNSNGTEGAPSNNVDEFPRVQNFENLKNAGITQGTTSIGSDGTTMWVMDTHIDRRTIFAYTLATEARDPAKDILLADATGSPSGIWAAGLFDAVVFVLNRPSAATTGEIHAYNVSTGRRATGEEFTAIIGGSNASSNRDIWSDEIGGTMWVLNDEDDMIYAYDFDNKTRDMPDIALHTDNTDPLGIWSNRSRRISAADATMWVLDTTDNRIYAYDLAGNREMDNEFTLATGNDDPWSIWSNGTTMFVLDRTDRRIYKYSMETKLLITVTE